MHLLLSLSFLALTSAVTFPVHNVRRAICTVTSHNDPLKDDVPNIQVALKTCGDTRTIIFPANTTFNIGTPLKLSLCKRFQIQIDGTLRFSNDWTYWQTQTVGIIIPNVSNAVITSSSIGVIDANGFGWRPNPAPNVPRKMPTLLSIEKGSSQIYISNLLVRDAPGTVIHVSSDSSAIHFSNIENDRVAKIGYQIQNAQHVYINNSAIRASDSCFSIHPNTTNVKMMGLQCSTYEETNRPEDGPNAIEMRLSSDESENWIRNVLIKNVETTGWMNVIGFTDFVATVSGGQWVRASFSTRHRKHTLTLCLHIIDQHHEREFLRYRFRRRRAKSSMDRQPP